MAFIQFLVKSLMKVETEGIDNLPKNGRTILAANHVTNFDVLVMQVYTPRPIFFMAKIQLYSQYSDWWLRRMGAFPVIRGEKDVWSLNHARKVLEDKEQTLGMFPEGTRSKGKGLRRGKMGTARLALETNTPIIPMAVIGTDEVFSKFPKRNQAKIKMGEAILPSNGDTPEELTTRYMTVIAKMLPEYMRGIYA